MWKTLILLVIVGMLIWLGYMEDQQPSADVATSAQLENSNKTLLPELNDEASQAETALGDTLNSANELLSVSTDAAVAGMNNVTDDASGTADSLTNAPELSADAYSISVDTATETLETRVDSATEEMLENSETTDVTETQVSEQLTQPLSLSGLSRKIGAAIGTTTSLLSGVTDEASAIAVLPTLTQVSKSLNESVDSFTQIPEAAKAPLSKLINSGIEKIQPLADKALSIPGAGDVLAPVIGPMMDTLQGLAQQPQ